jgi:hypothetical protein
MIFLALEMMLEDMLVDGDEDPIPKHTEDEYLQLNMSDGDAEMEDEATPCPTKKKDQPSGSEYSDVGQDKQFQTPLTLKKSKNTRSIVIDIDSSSLLELSDAEELKEAMGKGKGKKVVDNKDSCKRAKVLRDVTVAIHESRETLALCRKQRFSVF